MTSIMESKLFYCCQCWSDDAVHCIGALDYPRLKAWRSVRGWHNYQREADHVPDAAVWLDAKRLPALDCARLARLRYLPRLCKVSPPELFALLQAAHPASFAWQRQLYGDIDLMRQVAALDDWVRSMPHPLEDPHAAFAYFAGGAQGWKEAIHRFAVALRRMHVADLLRPGAAVAPPAADAELHECLLCDAGRRRSFHSKSALLSHQHRVHGVLSPLRSFVYGTHCACCLKEFWSFERCAHHLARASCIGRLMTRVPVEPSVVAERLRASRADHRANARAGRSHRVASRPSMRLAGPLCEWAVTARGE